MKYLLLLSFLLISACTKPEEILPFNQYLTKIEYMKARSVEVICNNLNGETVLHGDGIYYCKYNDKEYNYDTLTDAFDFVLTEMKNKK